jgi:succinylglutamate desuccinylase
MHNNEHISFMQTADKECLVLIATKAAEMSIFSTGRIKELGLVLDLSK